MPAKVILKVESGADSGKEEVFEEKESLIIGRMDDCNFRLNDGTVSRYHCLMEINPPEVTIRDFGSMNGTFLNAKEIGKREDGMSAEEGQKQRFNEFTLNNGDKLGVGPECKLFISTQIPEYCAECLCELPAPGSPDRFEQKPGVILCKKCNGKKKADAPVIKKKKKCSICQAPLSAYVKAGDLICDKCRKDPLNILENLLKNALAGIGDAAEIKGYKKINLLGRGGMGEVWLVEEEATGKEMALKLMLPKVAAQERNRDRFLLEAKIAGELNHKNVVKQFKSGSCDGTFFMLLEFCKGNSVDSLMQKRGGKLPVDLAVNIILQTLDGLEYTHNASIPEVKLANGKTKSAKGVVHRDLSPHNIFLSDTSDSPIAKVADFGLSKAFETAGLTGNTRTGEAAGKPVFMPRQQAINFKYSKPDVDVWAAAATLYNMLTGAFPRDFPLNVDVWQTLLTTAPVPIRQRDPSIPQKLAAVIDEALVDKPDIKIKTAKELKRRLEKAF